MQMFGNTLKVMTFDWLRTIDTREIVSLSFTFLENRYWEKTKFITMFSMEFYMFKEKTVDECMIRYIPGVDGT